ncbi:MAG: 23S rRNA (adenine(2503)-C(2))-methyltransferase RlmN [Bacilli bacterium]|nr:23S rRNA (adenine(2503)-C(2))-methyltransferase RlmN [Bacilli bacterium]
MSIYDLSFEELEEYILNNGGKKYNASQIWEWLYIHKVNSYEEMTNVKKELLEKLNSNFSIALLDVEKIERDSDVNKYLFKLDDGNYIEAVLMKHDYGNSICISSQVGCNMGCKFCESGRLKKRRDLTTGEMIRQILQVEDDLGDRISHVVVMGIGEPFDNYDNVIKMIKIINHPKGLAIGARHITVSTCGIIPKIKEFMNLDLQVNLAISLHAPNDKLRSELMPINKAYPLKDLMKVLKEYTEKTNRRLTFEYIMLKDINDSEECALELVSLIKGINSYVNLIPYNETENLEFNRSNLVQINKFYDILKKNRINVTIRREFGGNISAACGQLRSRKEDL